MRVFVFLMIVLGALTIDHGYAIAGSHDSRSSYNNAGGSLFGSHSNSQLFESPVTTTPDAKNTGEQTCQDTAPECSSSTEPLYRERNSDKTAHEKDAGRHAH
ncbi:MAG: hypothetical protein ACOYW7_12605 [Nitrospirota bacterium]